MPVLGFTIATALHTVQRSLKKANTMLAFLILFLAAFSRLLPHAMHGTGLNFTAVGAGLLFFGSRSPRWQAVIGAAVMALTDVYLTTVVYGMHFHLRSYITTWVWYACVCLIGCALLRKVTVLRVIAGVLASATGFFLWSDFFVWAFGHMYPHTASGLVACYAAAVPFYGRDLVSTAIFSAILFGLPVLAARMVESMQSHPGQPLA
jgi:hypothetical protein